MNKAIVMILAIALLAYGCSQNVESNKPDVQMQQITSGTTGMGDVKIDLTPKWTNNGLVVDFAANTHSVDLSKYDLTKITTLVINGEEISPVSAPTLRGHHNYGKLVFNTPKSDTFKIIINNIPNVEKREFTW